MIKKYEKFLNENMGYTDFFGKEVTHEQAIQKRVRDLITQIIMDERGISEKSFTQLDEVIDEVKNICDENPDIYKNAEQYYNDGKRLQLFVENVYDKHFKSTKLNEMTKAAMDRQNETDDVKGKVSRSKKLSKEMKEKILPLIITGNSGPGKPLQTKYKKGKVFYLKYSKSNGCSLGADKNGFFVFTHRARSKSKPEIDKIPQNDIKFVASTG